MLMKGFEFPRDFQLGVASAATQIDGDCKNSNWYDWYLKGHIKDGSDPDIATMHRRYMAEDTALMADMGIRHYRFGLEWARIEPEDGQFSSEEFRRVREEILLLQKNGIHVLLTIHHFSNPMWFEKKGAFLSPDAVSVFLRLVRRVAEELGNLVNEFITINEPNVYALNGYLGGGFPPGRNNVFEALKIMKVMGECHRRAYEIIHELRRGMGYSDTRVGFAHHMRAFTPWNGLNPIFRAAAVSSEKLFQTGISRSYILGDSKYPGRFADFLAVNYYALTASKGFSDAVRPGSPVNDLGWAIYPAGIVECCRKLHSFAPDLPIYITENGIADNNDSFRRRYIYEHIKALCESGLRITRYYHWCFVDNFEWLEGFSARFGLVEFDTETMARRVKKSGEFYKSMVANRGVTDEQASEVCKEEYPHA